MAIILNGTTGITSPGGDVSVSQSLSGNLVFTGTGNRITGDFSNVTIANRVTFQTSTTNGNTLVAAMPNGTATTAGLWAFNNSDLTNAGRFRLTAQSSEMALVADYNGTGTYLPMTFYTGGSERLRLDTSGNLGLGVTPSAWAGSSKAIQTPAGSLYAQGGTSFLILGQNVYGDGTNDRYVNTAAASRYYQNAGSHFWNTAPSGTAGNAITFTQAMTLDANNRLGVGVTSPTTVLDVYSASVGIIQVRGGSGTNEGGAFYVRNSANSGTLAAFGDRARIFGGTPDASVSLFTSGSAPLIFDVGGGEKARIDSSGNLLVGTTSGGLYGSKQHIFGSSCLDITNNAVSSVGIGIAIRRTDSAGGEAMRFIANTTVVGYINTTSSATSYLTSSDYRLKENVAPMTGALAKVSQLKPCTYTWKADGSAGQGFIAHELQAVVPDCVTGDKDAVDAEGNPKYQGVDTSFLVATLTAAIQELKAEVDSLKAQLQGAA